MTSITLSATESATGEVKLPGSKSISNRLLLLAALADGETTLHNVLDADDTRYLIDAMAKLGVAVDNLGGNSYKIHGCNGKFSITKAELFLGNAGTAFRPLTAALAFMSGTYILQGDPRMYERPIGDLVEALRSLGAQIEYLENEGYPPLKISPFKDNGNAEVSIKGNISSQFLTALLMAAPLLKRPIAIKVTGDLISAPYIKITRRLLGEAFSVFYKDDTYFDYPELQKSKTSKYYWKKFILQEACQYKTPREYWVEGDASSASYFLEAGLLGGGPVKTYGINKNSIQGDAKFAEELATLGAVIEYGNDFIQASSPDKTNRLWSEDRRLKYKKNLDDSTVDESTQLLFDAKEIPDAAMGFAILALKGIGITRIENIGSWRVKECDRISAIATELRKLGAKVIEGSDFIQIIPPYELNDNVTIDTYNDHRMAMCFSLVSLMGVSVTINNPECVSKTFPDYFEVFAKLTKVK